MEIQTQAGINALRNVSRKRWVKVRVIELEDLADYLKATHQKIIGHDWNVYENGKWTPAIMLGPADVELAKSDEHQSRQGEA